MLAAMTVSPLVGLFIEFSSQKPIT